MLSRESIQELYHLILDREPESEDVINQKRQAESLQLVALGMLGSVEFVSNNKTLIKKIFD